MNNLEKVMQRNAPDWMSVQRTAMRALGARYLSMPRTATTTEIDALMVEIRAVNPTAEKADPTSSWSVFATWVVHRAHRFAKRLKDG